MIPHENYKLMCFSLSIFTSSVTYPEIWRCASSALTSTSPARDVIASPNCEICDTDDLAYSIFIFQLISVLTKYLSGRELSEIVDQHNLIQMLSNDYLHREILIEKASFS